MELTLGPDTVEDDAVDGDSDDFNGDLNEAADKRPVLTEVLVRSSMPDF